MTTPGQPAATTSHNTNDSAPWVRRRSARPETVPAVPASSSAISRTATKSPITTMRASGLRIPTFERNPSHAATAAAVAAITSSTSHGVRARTMMLTACASSSSMVGPTTNAGTDHQPMEISRSKVPAFTSSGGSTANSSASIITHQTAAIRPAQMARPPTGRAKWKPSRRSERSLPKVAAPNTRASPYPKTTMRISETTSRTSLGR